LILAGARKNEKINTLVVHGTRNYHVFKNSLEDIVSKRLGSPYRSGRFRYWVKSKNQQHPAVKREAEEDWGKERWR